MLAKLNRWPSAEAIFIQLDHDVMYAADLRPGEYADGESGDRRNPMGFRPCSREGREEGDEKDDTDSP